MQSNCPQWPRKHANQLRRLRGTSPAALSPSEDLPAFSLLANDAVGSAGATDRVSGESASCVAKSERGSGCGWGWLFC